MYCYFFYQGNFIQKFLLSNRLSFIFFSVRNEMAYKLILFCLICSVALLCFQ